MLRWGENQVDIIARKERLLHDGNPHSLQRRSDGRDSFRMA